MTDIINKTDNVIIINRSDKPFLTLKMESSNRVRVSIDCLFYFSLIPFEKEWIHFKPHIWEKIKGKVEPPSLYW